jgi:hypothetical protein
VNSPKLKKNGVSENVKAVNAVAIRDGGKLHIIATNLTNKRASVRIRIDNVFKTNLSYKAKGLRYSRLKTGSTIFVNDSRVSGKNVITLPPYSVIKIEDITNNGSALKNIGGKTRTSNDVEQESSLDLKAYPNPSETGVFTLTESVKWQVYTIQGSIILKGESNNVNLSRFKKGFYFLKTDKNVLKLIVK